MRRGVLATIFASILLVTASASASIVYNNGGPNGASGNETVAWVQADDFSIGGGATIRSAGVYIAGFDGIGAWDGNLRYFIFSDNAGAPGAQLASALVTPTVTDSGVAWCCGGNAYLLAFDLAADFNAVAGTTYWLGIHAGADSNFNRDDIYWVTTAGSGFVGHESQGGIGNWVGNGQDHAFFLADSTIAAPEPATLAILGTGLLGLAAARRRKAA